VDRDRACRMTHQRGFGLERKDHLKEGEARRRAREAS
jgi:hypothetical protein